MSGSFYYGLKARFYGLLFQLPWSFFVTVCVLTPVVYVVDHQVRSLLISLVIYWTLFTALIWLLKDLHTQRFLLDFVVRDQHLCVYKRNTLITMYALNQIKKVKKIPQNSLISKAALGSGVIVTFDDGCEMPIFDQISNFENLSDILQSRVIAA